MNTRYLAAFPFTYHRFYTPGWSAWMERRRMLAWDTHRSWRCSCGDCRSSWWPSSALWHGSDQEDGSGLEQRSPHLVPCVGERGREGGSRGERENQDYFIGCILILRLSLNYKYWAKTESKVARNIRDLSLSRQLVLPQTLPYQCEHTSETEAIST